MGLLFIAKVQTSQEFQTSKIMFGEVPPLVRIHANLTFP